MTTKRTAIAVLVPVAGALLSILHSPPAAAAGPLLSKQTRLAASAAAGAQLGQSVAISGATVVVGASGDDTVAADAGAADVLVRSGSSWVLQQKLFPGTAWSCSSTTARRT
jgi:hypothetical protein